MKKTNEHKNERSQGPRSIKRTGVAFLFLAPFLLNACSSMRGFFAANSNERDVRPISNPFGEQFGAESQKSQNMVLRTKKGDRAVEVELPNRPQEVSDLIIPLSPSFKDGEPSSEESNPNGIDTRYSNRAPSSTDREIMASLPQGLPEDEAKRNEIERELGLIATENPQNDQNKSYLGGIDRIKQLYRTGRYEVALLEADEMIRQYQTDPKLYQMRGTLLERLGRNELALKAWNQALRFDPKNSGLRRFVERRQQKAGVIPQ